ncbi:MAG TPA: hypothetical protein VHM92_03660 [Allosphingosinicella sp.]|nr:hypothetical protein [Allosphingosinicella sp.]
MSIMSLLKRVEKALPVVIAHIPIAKAAIKEVGAAFRKEKKPAAGESAG